MKYIHKSILIIMVSFLIGCGFQLRGIQEKLPEKFEQTNLIHSDDDNDYLYSQIKRLIQVNGGNIVDANESLIDVRISPIRTHSRQIALSGDGSIKEYERTYAITVTVTDTKTRLQYGQRTISTTRNLQLDDRKILGGEEQTEITLQTASRNLAQLTVHYLSSFE